MAARRGGRRPKSKALKLLAGKPGHRALQKTEPKVRIEEPPCPDHLDVAARAEWRRIVPILLEIGVLSACDLAALAGYCQAWSRWVTAEKALADVGTFTIATGSGSLKIHPSFLVANRALSDLRQVSVELGLTPASRTRIHAAPKEAASDPSERFFRPRLVPPAPPKA